MQKMQNVDNEKLATLINEIEAFVTETHTNQELKSIMRQRPMFFASIITNLIKIESGQINCKAFVDLALSETYNKKVWLGCRHTPTKIKEFLKNDCGLPKSKIMEIICCYI